MTAPDNTATALRGLRVLEFSHTIMGPCAGLLLADLGAEVIKVEPAPDGDRTRKLGGFAAGFFATYNRNKKSIAVNLKTDSGRELIYRLIKDTDIVLENYGPGTMEKLGCDWPTLSAINPGLIYLALKGYLAGPWQDRPALDEVVQFQSGLAYMTGPVGQPLRAGASVVDILGAVFGVTGVLAAVREKEQTGTGQRVGTALFESAVFLMGSHMAGSAATGEPLPPMTVRRGAWGIYDVFTTVDGKQLFIGVTSDAQWQRFCQEFGYADFAADTRLHSNNQRVESRSWLIPDLATRIASIDYTRVVELSGRADISWSPVGRPEDLLSNEQLLGRGGLLQTLLDSTGSTARGETLLPALPLEFGAQKQRPGLQQQPPTLGQHTHAVLSASGYSDTEITALQRSNTVI